MRAAVGRARAAWSVLTGTGAAASAGLALLVLACTFIAVAVPRASLGYRTRALQRLFAAASATQRSVTAGSGFQDFTGGGSTVLEADLALARSEIAAALRTTGLPLAPPAADWSGLTTGVAGVPGVTVGGLPLQLELAYRDTLGRNARLVSGSLPVRAYAVRGRLAFQVAVTAATAARLGLRDGSLLRLAGGPILVVSGIIRPVAASSAFWAADPIALVPAAVQPPPRSSLPAILDGGAFVGPAELLQLESSASMAATQLSWGFPLRLGGVNADQAPALRDHLIRATNLSGAFGAGAGISFTSGLTSAVATFVASDDAVARMLSLLFVSLTAIGMIVVLLGAGLLTEHRDGELALMRARGASLRQLAGLALRGGAVVALPAAALASAAAVAVTAGPAEPLGWWLAGLTALVALAGPPLLAVRRHAARREARRRPAAARRRIAAARRWVSDVALVCAAVGGLVILRNQGLPQQGGMDLYTSAAPALAAIPAAIAVMRLYPVALGWMLRLAARRRGVTAFVGIARGTRTGMSSVLPAFALVLALALIAFGAMVRGAITHGEVAASWQATGGDAVVSTGSSGAVSLAVQRSLAAAPGVERTSTLTLASAISAGGDSLAVVFVEPARYAALLAGTPAPQFQAAALARTSNGAGGTAAAVPVLVSPAARTILGHGPLTLFGRSVKIRVAGTLAAIAAVPAGTAFVVLPEWAAGSHPVAPSAMVIIGSHLDGAALRSIVSSGVPGGNLTLRSDVLAALAGAPLQHGGYVAFAQGAAAAAGFSVLILLLTLLLGARSRALTLARLATMGLAGRQARQLAVVEAVPAVLAATLGGAACALALVPLIGPAIDLSAFTGSGTSVPITAEPAAVAASALGLLLLALLTLTIQAAVGSHRGAARALRVGE